MKTERVTRFESVEIVCPKNKNHKLTPILDENYCEAGACLRLVCKDCGDNDVRYEEVLDCGLRGELGDWNEVVQKFKKIKEGQDGVWD